MTHPRALHVSLALAAALALVLPAVPGAAKKAKDSASTEQAAAEQDAAPKTKAEKKAEKEAEKAAGKKQKVTKESKRRAEIESGAKTAVEWYADALKLYEHGKYLDSRAILLPLEDAARAVDIQERVKLLIADTYFEQGGALNLAEALARYKSFLTFFPGSENAAYAQYQLGRSYFKQLGHPDRDQSFTDQAIFEYQKLIDNYPDSPYVAQAQKDVLEAKARRAQHEFEVAEFYWDWNDKRACASRLMQVLRERPELPAREKALFMCAQSLYDTGRREEGDAYAARLTADYPGSQYASKLNPNSPGAIEKQVKREAKQEKETARTYKAQQRQERRRTRLVRKDSGLPADVPQTWDLPGGSAPAAAAAPAGAPPTPQDEAKARERALAASAAAQKAEKEEQERAAKEAEREAKRKAEDEKTAQKRAEKKAKEEAALAAETPEQKAKREKKEAKAKKEAERKEAEEAKHK